MGGEGPQILLLVAEEHRHRQQQPTAPGRNRGLAERDRAPHGRGTDANEQPAIARQPVRGPTNDGGSLSRFEMRILPRRAADANAIDARGDQKLHQAVEPRLVEAPVVMNRRSNRRKKTCHW